MALQKREQTDLVLSGEPKESKQRPQQKKNVLDEDTYTENIEKIIVRDFYPDLPKLQAQADYLDAFKSNDVDKLREIHLKYGPKRGSSVTPSIYSTPATFETPETKAKATPRDSTSIDNTCDTPAASKDDKSMDEEILPTHNPEPENKEVNTDHSLDKFLSKHTSEDNASFEEIMTESDHKHQARHAWLYEQQAEKKEELEKQLALPGIAQQAIESGPRSSRLQTWTYTPKNHVMYVPEGVAKTAEEKTQDLGYCREIIHTNTRFKNNPFNMDKNKGLLSEAASTKAQNQQGRIGADGKEILPQETPKINGYGFMGTPSPAPGVQDSPMMTWGEIEGTPFRLDGSDTPLVTSGVGQGPLFKIPDVPKRDRIGLELAEKASKAHRMKKQDALKRMSANFSSSSPKFGAASKTERLMNLSPAAQRLANAKLGIRTNTDKALRDSYTPSPIHRLPGDKTPLSLTPGSSRSTPGSSRRTPKTQTPGRRTPGTTPKREGAEVTSLTDNLLNLPKRPKASDFFS